MEVNLEETFLLRPFGCKTISHLPTALEDKQYSSKIQIQELRHEAQNRRYSQQKLQFRC